MQQAPRFNPLGGPADVPGFRVGQSQDLSGPTGLSVVLCPDNTVGGIDIRGSAAGTRQVDGLTPGHLVQRVHAVLFTGGSAFGLDAAGGVASWLAERGVGVDAGPVKVPIVPTAVLFDLPISATGRRPDAAMARDACDAATDGPMARGNAGAGAGATIGKLFGVPQATKGGLGGASLAVGNLCMGALAVVNCFGDVLDEQGRIIAGARTATDSRQFAGTAGWFLAGGVRDSFEPASNTTLAVVTTNAKLDKQEACKVAALAHHGLVRSINPVHTLFDGDLVVVLSSGEEAGDVNGLGVMAARLLEMAVRDAVRSTYSLAGLPTARELTED